jgi:hypothetical protein
MDFEEFRRNWLQRRISSQIHHTSTYFAGRNNREAIPRGSVAVYLDSIQSFVTRILQSITSPQRYYQTFRKPEAHRSKGNMMILFKYNNVVYRIDLCAAQIFRNTRSGELLEQSPGTFLGLVLISAQSMLGVRHQKLGPISRPENVGLCVHNREKLQYLLV